MSAATISDIQWLLEPRKLAVIHDHALNPRRLTKEQASQLEASIKRFGLIDKPIINVDGGIIAGHQRVRLLRRMRVKECECHVPSRLLLQHEVDELNVRHNRNTGEWDWDILANQFAPEDLLEWGFSDKELDIDVADNVDIGLEASKAEPVMCSECGRKLPAKKR